MTSYHHPIYTLKYPLNFGTHAGVCSGTSTVYLCCYAFSGLTKVFYNIQYGVYGISVYSAHLGQ